jgi:hypothetical protein
MDALLTRLVVLLDLLWDSTKDHIGLWALIYDVIEGMLQEAKLANKPIPRPKNNKPTRN